jgi:formamidopyrimidine-DNA glycosylase
MLATRRRALKPLLLDQNFLAGLGNIYVDEALWAAGLHPLRPAAALNRTQVDALHRAIRRVLRRGLANGGTRLGHGQSNFQSVQHRETASAPLNVFQRHGQPCPRCGSPVQRLVVAQRGTHVCLRCQPPASAGRV